MRMLLLLLLACGGPDDARPDTPEGTAVDDLCASLASCDRVDAATCDAVVASVVVGAESQGCDAELEALTACASPADACPVTACEPEADALRACVDYPGALPLVGVPPWIEGFCGATDDCGGAYLECIEDALITEHEDEAVGCASSLQAWAGCVQEHGFCDGGELAYYTDDCGAAYDTLDACRYD
jgi:hypothetical protein